MNKSNIQFDVLKQFFSRHRKSLIYLIPLFVLFFCALFFLTYSIYAASHTEVDSSELPVEKFIMFKTKKDKPIPEPEVLPRRLDGMIVSRTDANRVPVCVMIENAAFGGVRPQSGLSSASVVYEVIVEGGITRLMAVFAGEKAATVGPVRSARDTYLEFVSELNCAYVHAGGSFTALQALRNFSLRDLEGLREAQYFYRDPQRFSPHNLFTSTDSLYEAVDDHSWSTQEPPSYTEWNFVDTLDAASFALTPARSVTIRFGGAYDVRFDYNESGAYYSRFNGGQVHTDAITDQQLTARTVIVQHVGDGISIEGKGRVNWPVTGEGVVDVYTGGQKITGVWKKPSRLERTQFYDEQGQLIPFLRGNVWVEIVPGYIGVESE